MISYIGSFDTYSKNTLRESRIQLSVCRQGEWSGMNDVVILAAGLPAPELPP